MVDPLFLTGLILGQIYSRYWVIFPMPKSIVFPNICRKIPNFKSDKNRIKFHHFYHGKSWLKTVEYSTIHNLI